MAVDSIIRLLFTNGPCVILRTHCCLPPVHTPLPALPLILLQQAALEAQHKNKINLDVDEMKIKYLLE